MNSLSRLFFWPISWTFVKSVLLAEKRTNNKIWFTFANHSHLNQDCERREFSSVFLSAKKWFTLFARLLFLLNWLNSIARLVQQEWKSYKTAFSSGWQSAKAEHDVANAQFVLNQLEQRAPEQPEPMEHSKNVLVFHHHHHHPREILQLWNRESMAFWTNLIKKHGKQ